MTVIRLERDARAPREGPNLTTHGPAVDTVEHEG